MNSQRAVKHSFYILISMTIFLLAACGQMPNPTPSPAPSPVIEPQSMGWVQLGRSLNEGPAEYGSVPQIISDDAGNLVVVAAYRRQELRELRVNRWNGSDWEQLGGVLNEAGQFFEISAALDSMGNPVVSWIESDYIHVKRWNGNYWEAMNNTLRFDGNNSYSTRVLDSSLALDVHDNPIVSWGQNEIINGYYHYRLHIQRWNGIEWEYAGGALSSDEFNGATTSQIAVDSSNNLVVSMIKYEGDQGNLYVKRWDGSNWIQLGGRLNNNHVSGYQSLLAIDNSDNLVVVWYELLSDRSSQIYVKRWDGNNWLQFGFFPNGSGVYPAALAFDNDDHPMIAWEEHPSPSNINLKVSRWSNGDWRQLGSAVNNLRIGQFSSSMTVDESGNPVVSFVEGYGSDLFVKRYTDTTGSSLQELNFDPCVYKANCITPRVFVRIPPGVCWVCNLNLHIPYENPYRIGFSLPELGLDPDKFAQVFAVKLLSGDKVLAEGNITTQDNGNGKEAVLELVSKLPKGSYTVQLEVLDKEIGKLLQTTDDKYPFTFSLELAQ